MLTIQNQVTIPELHQLLQSIVAQRPNLCIRFRLIGELWRTNFLQVISFEDNTAIFYDEKQNRNLLISDLTRLIQFELDAPFQQYQPHFHYTIEIRSEGE
jgi:hypothetical protein